MSDTSGVRMHRARNPRLQCQHDDHQGSRPRDRIIASLRAVAATFPMAGNQAERDEPSRDLGGVLRYRWFESGFLRRRVACEPDLLRVLVQTNAGLEIDNGTIVTNFGAVSVGGNVQIQNCSEVDVDNPRSRAM